MATQADSQLAAKLHSWCSEACLDPNHAFGLFDVPTNTDQADIEETVQTVMALGRVKVRDVQSDIQTGSNLVQPGECRDVVQPDRIPPPTAASEGRLRMENVPLQ